MHSSARRNRTGPCRGFNRWFE